MENFDYLEDALKKGKKYRTLYLLTLKGSADLRDKEAFRDSGDNTKASARIYDSYTDSLMWKNVKANSKGLFILTARYGRVYLHEFIYQ